MIRAAFLARNDMVYFQVLLLEMLTATGAIAALLPVQAFPVLRRVVLANPAYVGAIRYVLAVNYVAKKPLALLYPLHYQFCRLWRYVYADPVAAQVICRYAGCGATAERIKDYIPLIRASRKNAFQKRQRFLSWIAYAFLRLGLDGWNIVPDRINRSTWHFIQITLVPRYPPPSAN